MNGCLLVCIIGALFLAVPMFRAFILCAIAIYVIIAILKFAVDIIMECPLLFCIVLLSLLIASCIFN